MFVIPGFFWRGGRSQLIIRSVARSLAKEEGIFQHMV